MPDLYADAPAGAGLTTLQITVQRFRDALGAHGGGEGEGGGGASAASTSGVAAAGWMVLPAADGDGGGGGGIDAAGGLGGGGGAAPRVGAKRSRDGAAAPQASAAAADLVAPAPAPFASASASTAVAPSPPPPPRPSALEAFSKPSAAAAKSIIRGLTTAAHDLFGAADRSKAGFSKAVPAAWRTFIEARFKSLNELLAYLWSATHARGSAAVLSRRELLRARLNVEFDALERIKKAVMARGAGSLLPPLETVGGDARDVEVMLVEDEAAAAAATSELVSLLLMLQGSVHASLLAAGQTAGQGIGGSGGR